MSDEIRDGKPRKEECDAEASGRLSRREFLRGVSISAGVLATGTYPLLSAIANASSEQPSRLAPIDQLKEAAEGSVDINMPSKTIWYAPPPAKKRFGMVIDVKACIGCRKCVYACMRENNIGRNSGFAYIQVMEMEAGSWELEHSTSTYKEGGSPEHWYMPIQCMQCEKPPCVYGCPVKATWKESDGIVVIDYKKCIACRFCMITCPYFARHFNWVEPYVPKAEINHKVPLEEKAGVVEKCTFCIHRTREGLVTRCTEVCPVQARKFGDLNDPNSEVSEILRTRRVFRLKEELGTEPTIYYVG